MFYELSGTRQYIATGYSVFPSRLQFSEIKAFLELHKLSLSAWEVEVIVALDAAYVSQTNKERDRYAQGE